MLSVLMIYASYFAMKAEINFGVVSSCLSVGAPLNCVLGYLLWKEKLSKIIIVGTAVILCGVVWVALAKGKDLSSENAKYMSEDDVQDMMEMNEFIVEQDEDDEPDVDEATEWADFDADC